MKFIVLMTTIIAVMASNVVAQPLGDPEAGLNFAKRVCAECHWVLPKESKSIYSNAASFKEIANTPGMTAQALYVWFRTPHPTMPNLKLEIQNEEDVIAYILSLKDKN